MRAGVMLVAAALGGCGFTASGSVAGDDVPGDDTMTPHAIVDDEADDFKRHLSGLSDAVIADRGAIEPATFVTDGLHARAYVMSGIVTSTATWDEIQTKLVAPVGEAWSVVPKDWGVSRPRGLGLSDDNNFIVSFDGEVKLPVGNVDFAIDIDDHALLQISLDGGTTWDGFYDDTGNGITTHTFAVPAAGWYPIRIAFEEGIVNARAAISVGASGGALTPIDATMLRARVTDQRGLLLHAWASLGFGADVATESVLPAPDVDFMNQPLKNDLGLDKDNFTLRLTGQILIKQEATYTFSVTTEQEAWRVLVDGKLVGNTWQPQITTPAENIALTPGWHDILIDYIEGAGNANLHLRVVGGDFTGMVAPDRLRPVAAQGRFLVLADPDSHLLVDATNATTPGVQMFDLTTKAVVGGTLEMTDWLYDIDGRNTNDAAQISAQLVCLPSNKTSTSMIPPDQMNQAVVPLSDMTCAGEPFNGQWRFIYTDKTPGGGVGSVKDVIVATYHGGDVRQPFAQRAEYVSVPIPTPGAIGYGRASFTADARGADVRLFVRAADTEIDLDVAPWVQVADDETPQVPPKELLQYKVTIAQDGWQNASVDRVSLIYTTR